jgi:eukaryotic-like serine/threonine-protein kinase
MSSEAQPRVESRALKLPERYRVRRHIATGGMASVWCADDLVLGRTVAVKVLAERFAHDEMAVRRFKREARAAARVSAHPHVVTIFDVGDLEPDQNAHGEIVRAFIVMEHLAGGTVADAVRVGAVKRQEALRWLREAASALDHAHERGIVHRDIKPGNFLLDRARVLRVADFGIARLASEDTITSSGELFGTAAYLAPEQALGRDATSASDRYALAVAAFELLAGERPFTAPHFAAQARQHIEDAPPSASERDRTLAPAVDPVLMRGMAKQPDARYETAGALVGAIESALGDNSTTVTRVVRNGRRSNGAAALPAPGQAPARTRETAAAPRRPVTSNREAATQPRRPVTTNREAARPPRRPATTNREAATQPRRPVTTNREAARPPRRPASADRARPAPVTAQIPGSPPRRRGGRALALAALLIAALGVGLVAFGGLDGPGKSSSNPRRLASSRAATASHRARPVKPPTTTSPATPITQASSSATTTSTAPPTAEQLQQTGHQELLAGSYQTAISTLRQAVSAAAPTGLTYAYALYDLGRSLTLGGDPSAAVPVLEARLQIPNETATVRQALEQALRASGQAPAQPVPSAPARPEASGSAPVSGGAGLAPGDHHGHGHGRASTKGL